MKKKYMITDPCYLYNTEEENERWRTFGDSKRFGEDWLDAFERDILDDLKSQFDVPMVLGSTGFGDWSNTMFSESPHAKIVERSFAADTGQVMIVELTPEVEKAWMGDGFGRAIVEIDFDGEIELEIKEDPDWSVAYIYGDGEVLAHSMLTIRDFPEDDEEWYE